MRRENWRFLIEERASDSWNVNMKHDMHNYSTWVKLVCCVSKISSDCGCQSKKIGVCMEVSLLSVGARGFFLAASRLAFVASPLNSVIPNEKKTSGTQGTGHVHVHMCNLWYCYKAAMSSNVMLILLTSGILFCFFVCLFFFFFNRQNRWPGYQSETVFHELPQGQARVEGTTIQTNQRCKWVLKYCANNNIFLIIHNEWGSKKLMF